MIQAHLQTLVFLLLSISTSSFSLPFSRPTSPSIISSRATMPALNSLPTSLIEPSQRDSQYGSNIAQYLIDLHDNQATFDFCGGMMFQLVLTDKLKTYLSQVATSGSKEQPYIFDATKRRMFQVPNYSKSADADNIRIFHGRELRSIPDASGGMGMVLQLSLANESDPQGWSKEEIEEYDGWGHDVGRNWRKAAIYEKEGFRGFQDQFGTKAFGLHHRFYLHLDERNQMWLSAEDGCEGTPSDGNVNPISRLFGF